MNHLIHSCILALVLYGIYRLTLKGSAGFQWHRLYLLAIPIVSALLPFIVVPVDFGLTRETALNPITMMEMPVMIDGNLQQTVVTTPDPIDFTMIIGTVYLAGMGIALFLFFYKLAQIQQWKDDGVTTYDDGCYVTRVKGLPSAFSFLNYIYMNDAFAKVEFDQILAHEKVHVMQKHSWDLLFYELLRILFWFHPVTYLAQQDLKLVHEFIADEQTIAIHDKKSYYQNLLKQVMDCPDYSFTNPFFKLKTVKTRLAMIQKTQNQKFPFHKLLWILPLLFASLIYTACTTEIEVEEDTVAEKTIMVEDLPTLQDHVYGQIDFYKGLTKEEISEYERVRSEIRETHPINNVTVDNYREIIEQMTTFKNDSKNKEFNRIAEIISKNGNTVVRDALNNNYILTIHESRSGSPTFTGTGPIDQANMSLAEYSKFIKGEKAKYENYKNPDIIEEIVEIEEVKNESSQMTGSIVDVPFTIIEEVPTYPGCFGSNQERKACMQEKITQFVIANFDTSIASAAGLSGKQTIPVQFKIDNKGDVTGVISRAKAPELQTEAARVINMLPKMTPGKQRGKEVGVIYGLPIIFEVI